MLEGTLVRLRAHMPSDLDPSLRWINDREVIRTLALRYPTALAEEESWLERMSRPAPGRSDVYFAIDTLEGRYIGNCAIHRVQWENRSAEVGILIGEKDCWDKGYGTDATRTMLRFAFEDMNLNRIELTVLDYNPRGQAAYRKCGFVEEGRKRLAIFKEGAYHDLLMMAVLRDEFEAVDARSA